MLLALPSAFAFGVIIYLPLGNSLAAEGAPAGMQQTAVFELQGSLFFGTANQLQAVLESEIGKRKYVILSMRRVQSPDVPATHVLEQIKTAGRK